jgi:hypothetical protein
MAVEQVARWPWNAWPDERGLGGRMVWNPHAAFNLLIDRGLELFHFRLAS